MYQQSRNKKQTDFIGRNRRAVRRDMTTTTLATEKNRKIKEKQNTKSTSNATVEISKSYLEKLLRMTLTQSTSDVQSRHDDVMTKPHHNDVMTKPPQNDVITQAPHNDVITKASHIESDHSKIPGLQHITSSSYGNHGNRHVEEEYYPWGRPGGGAPIRSISGRLLTNFTTRGQAVQDMRNGIQRQPVQDMRNGIQRQPVDTHYQKSSSKSQFARGLGPHVDDYILSQREEQRRKELNHKEELAAQIAERQRMKLIEKRKKEIEELEAEERVRREIDEINKRNEKEREIRQQKAAEEKAWQATLQARIQEAEEMALREKQLLITQQHKPHHDIPHSINMLPRKQHEEFSSRSTVTHYNDKVSSPPVPAIANKMTDNVIRPLYHRSPSPVVPALAKKLNPPSHHLPAAQQHNKLSNSLQSIATSSSSQHQNILLPSLPPAAMKHNTGLKFPTQPPNAVARQQAILSQLAILREGIDSQKKSLDNRIKQLIIQ